MIDGEHIKRQEKNPNSISKRILGSRTFAVAEMLAGIGLAFTGPGGWMPAAAMVLDSIIRLDSRRISPNGRGVGMYGYAWGKWN